MQTTYDTLLERYRDLLTRLRFVRERFEYNKDKETESELIEIDAAKKNLHTKLKSEGALAGKSAAEVNFQILLGDDNLKGWNLPEFKMMEAEQFFLEHRHAYLEFIEGASTEEEFLFPDFNKTTKVISNQNRYIGDTEDARLHYAFIPFEQQSTFHLYDSAPFRILKPDSLEKARRAKKAASAVGGEVGYAVIPDTLHQQERLLGIFFPKPKFEDVVYKLFLIRDEISIAPEHFSTAQIEKDWEYIVRKEAQTIIAEASAYESVDRLLEIFKRKIDFLNISEDLIDAALVIVETERAAYEERVGELNREDEKTRVDDGVEPEIGADLIDEYHDLSDLPSRGTHRRS